MNPSVSGSLDEPVSSIHFMKSGQMQVSSPKEGFITDEELATLLYTQEFLLYALERSDWFLEFFKLSKILPKEDEKPKPSLVLLQGGLNDENEE